MKKYGLQLRVPPSQQKKAPSKPPLAPIAGFRDDDDDENDVERDISRQATRSRALYDAEEQCKKALEEDPSVFDYDGVYDEMKEEIIRPQSQDREERKPRYIQALIKKAEERQRQHEVVYERKLAKERSKDDNLYADKDKFVTSAYKRKLAEQAKWMEEERLRELQEEKDDVTKKKDLSDFYFNLGKNVAFGAKDLESKKPERPTELKKPEKEEKMQEAIETREADTSYKGRSMSDTNLALEASSVVKNDQGGRSNIHEESFESLDSEPVPHNPVSGTSAPENISSNQPQPKQDHHKRNEDALAVAKERFLARKRAKEQ